MPEDILGCFLRGVVTDASDGSEDTYLDMYTLVNSVLTEVAQFKDGSIFMANIKSGTTQANAGAAANELWVTSGHASQEDNTVMIGV